MTQRSPATTKATRRRNSDVGSGIQPAWWLTESSSRKSAPSASATDRAKVDLPVPEVPTTETRRIEAGAEHTAAEPSNGPPSLSPAFPPSHDGLMIHAPVRAPRGVQRTCKGWATDAAIISTLQDLNDDETLLVQSGKPVGVLRTHEWAPRVLIANSNLVPQWATWEEFRRLEQLGLTMYGQMTAGSWIYIGTQGILQGTYETFAAIAAKRFGGSLAGTITLTAGLGGMGGAQPLAVTMNGGVVICIDCDPASISRRIEHGYLDIAADDGGADQRRHGSDVGARPADLPAKRRRVRGHGRAAGRGPGRVHPPCPRVDGRACRGDGRLHGRRSRGLRLRQLDPRRGRAGWLRAGVRLPRFRSRLHQAAVLRGPRAVPVGGPVRRPGRHRGDRPGHPRPVPRQRAAGQVDRDGGEEGSLPGPARQDLLARLRRAGQGRPALQRPGGQGRGQRADRARPGPSRLRLGGLAVPRD